MRLMLLPCTSHTIDMTKYYGIVPKHSAVDIVPKPLIDC